MPDDWRLLRLISQMDYPVISAISVRKAEWELRLTSQPFLCRLPVELMHRANGWTQLKWL